MRNQYMGVGKSMKIFMEGMQNSMMSSGYTGKIVNTPMGPFAWNEATNSWVNQNSGFSIPNISLHDLMMYDYGSVSDETSASNTKSTPCIYTLSTFSPPTQDAGRVPVISSQIGLTTQTLTDITCPVNIKYVQTPSTGGRLEDYWVYYSVNNGSTKPKLSSVSGVDVSAGSFKIYIGRSDNVLLSANISIDIINTSDNNTVLARYTASF
jgi:hypothetical protein